MEGLQLLGVIAFIYGILWATSLLKEARAGLPSEHQSLVRHIERGTVVNILGPLLPLVAGLGIVSLWMHEALGVAVAAILLTVLLLVARGLVHSTQMRRAGVPRAYRVSYRRAHAIRAASLAICAAAFVQPLLR
jgi:hypothetical protein